LVDKGTFTKTSQVTVIKKYNIDWNIDEVSNYYQRIFQEHGWTYNSGYVHPNTSVDWTYCKHDYSANYNYDENKHTWKYEIAIFWGISSECYMKKGIPLNVISILLGLLIAIIISIILNYKLWLFYSQ
jgi:hypothetical protein